jgi:glycine betaine/proline transport system substrate-binding protein
MFTARLRKVSMALLASALFSHSALAVESKDPIILTLHDWTGQLINTELMGRILQNMGYNIKYQQADYIAQFAGLESGDLHVAMEMWETTGKQAMEASVKTGDTVDLGETGMNAIEEWWYPMYMKEKCPGLPNCEGRPEPEHGL